MKKAFACIAVVCAGLLLGIGSAYAQMNNLVKVTLPVAVTVGSITLPAGECTIQALQSDGNGSVLLLRASNGMNVEVIANRINEARTANETHITLLTDGGTHHIDKVWLAGQQTGYELLAAK